MRCPRASTWTPDRWWACLLYTSRGVKGLQGAPVSATDLRAGAAIVLAGISAEGETRVHHIEHIDRGYEDYVGKLASLGADVRRAPADVPVSC